MTDHPESAGLDPAAAVRPDGRTLRSVTCRDEIETGDLARQIAPLLRPGDLVLLEGELGVGKTVFARALLESLGVRERITSPTFTIINEYAVTRPDGNITSALHVDLYRMRSATDAVGLGLEELLPNAVTIVEWPERLPSLAAQATLTVAIAIEPNGTRRFELRTTTPTVRSAFLPNSTGSAPQRRPAAHTNRMARDGLPRLIAVDTSGPWLGVLAAERFGERWSARAVEEEAGLRHTEAMLPAILRCCARASWAPGTAAAVLCCRGPGSFTGLRIGMAGAKGIAAAADAAVVSVSTTTACAADLIYRGWVLPGDRILVALDARQRRVYAALFEVPPADRTATALPVRIGADQDIAPEEISAGLLADLPIALKGGTVAPPGRLVVAGSGAPAVLAALQTRGIVDAAKVPFRSAVFGVLMCGLDALNRGDIDAPDQGPEYLREGEVGTTENRVRFEAPE